MTVGEIVFDLWGTLMTERRGMFPERAALRYAGVAPILARHGIAPTLEEFNERQRESNRALARLQEEGRDVSAEERARHVIAQFDAEAAARATDAEIAAFVEAYGGPIVPTP